MTKIDAINRMLRYIGELPIPNGVAIDDLEEGHEAVEARTILDETLREEQEEQWWFNKFTFTYLPFTCNCSDTFLLKTHRTATELFILGVSM